MRSKQGIGHRAQRTGAYAESKFTNWAGFSPGAEEIYRALARFDRQLEEADRVLIRTIPPRSASFMMPVTRADVSEVLDRVPQRFTKGLRAVFLLGGSQKQEEVAAGRLFAFGRYGSGCIFLHAFPVSQMKERWRTLPKPSIRREYERAGAVWQQIADGWLRVFTPESLRTFYLRDVLLHELGHHVDRGSRRSRNAAEAFANWMASELGYAKSSTAT